MNSNFDEMKHRNLKSYFSVDDACNLVKKAFRAAAEREISVGDGCEIWILRKNKIVSDSIESNEMKIRNTNNYKNDEVIDIENNQEYQENVKTFENIKTFHEILSEGEDDSFLSNQIDMNLNRIEGISKSNSNIDIEINYNNHDENMPPTSTNEINLMTNLIRKNKNYSFGRKKFHVEKQFFSLPLH